MAQSAGRGTGPVSSGSPKQSAGRSANTKQNVPREMGSVALIKHAMKGVEKKRFPNRFMSETGYKTGLSKQEETSS